MRPRAALVIGFACALAASSCAEPAAPPQVASTSGPLTAGSAQVCVLRPDAMAREVSMPVRDNGRLVGATRGMTFFCWLAVAGEHQISSVDDDTGPTFLEARAGARYWLHQEVSELAGTLHAHLDWVEEPAALEMMETCESRVRVSVPGHEDEPGAMPVAPARGRP